MVFHWQAHNYCAFKALKQLIPNFLKTIEDSNSDKLIIFYAQVIIQYFLWSRSNTLSLASGRCHKCTWRGYRTAQDSGRKLVECSLSEFTKNQSRWPLRSWHQSWCHRKASVSNQVWLGQLVVSSDFLLFNYSLKCLLKCLRTASCIFTWVWLHRWFSSSLFLSQLQGRCKATWKGVPEKFPSCQGESFST